MAGVNKVILVGYLGKDPEVRTLENGAVVASFSMATTESYKDKTTGDRKDVTEWHNVVLWRGLAEIAAKYLHKGDLVYIEGKLRTRSWEKDNITRYTTEIVGDNMNMLSTRPSSTTNTNSAYPTAQPSMNNSGDFKPSATDNSTDDLPF